MMDRFVGLIANIEQVIRYLLSGASIYAIILLSLRGPETGIQWIKDNPSLAGFITAAGGFAAYSIYRILFWVAGDGLAWLLRLSAPAIDRERESGLWYHGPYARFLLWRREERLDKNLDGYLHYRWAIIHFILIFSLALFIALIYRESGSIIDKWFYHTVALAIVCFVCGIWQCSLLFRVERELYRDSRPEQVIQADAQLRQWPEFLSRPWAWFKSKWSQWGKTRQS